MAQNKRVSLLAVVAVLGIVYCIVATRLWMMSWLPLLPLMQHVIFFRLFFGVFWFAIELAPITIAVTLLRVNALFAIVTLGAYLILMNAVQFAFEPNPGLLFPMAINLPLNLILQIPVWGLTWLAMRRARSLSGPK